MNLGSMWIYFAWVKFYMQFLHALCYQLRHPCNGHAIFSFITSSWNPRHYSYPRLDLNSSRARIWLQAYASFLHSSIHISSSRRTTGDTLRGPVLIYLTQHSFTKLLTHPMLASSQLFTSDSPILQSNFTIVCSL